MIGVLGFLPIANWLPGGHSAPWYQLVTSEWISGSAIVIGTALVGAIFSRSVPALWRAGALDRVMEMAEGRPWWFGFAVSGVATAVYATVALVVFSGVPLSIDELVQLIQARTFVQGRLWQPASPWPEFYSVLNMVDANGRYYGQFPPGGPAMLALGVLVRAPWLVGPVCGGISVASFWQCVRVVEPRRSVAVGATLLFAFAPFAVFMSGSHMNHVPTLMWITLAMFAMSRVMIAPSPRPGFALLSGLALGCVATIRPVDALAFAAPAGLWYLVRAARDRARWRDVIAAGFGVMVPVSLMLWANARTTGAPLLFGYQVLWGESHNLGFHRAPWGMTHTPARGVELVNLYFLRLQTYLYEASIPSLLPVVAALALTRTVRAFDRYLLSSAALVAALYFAYWHDGFLFGPRFVFVLLPVFALWTARLPALVRERFGEDTAYRATWYGLGTAALLAGTVSIPHRATDYARGMMPMRLDYIAPAREAGVRDALIFVRESWGTQLMARMWALGVPRSETEALYGGVDACVLEENIERLERGAVRDAAATAALAPLLRDSARVVKSPFSPDVTERYLAGTPYTPRCVQRLAEDRGGFTLLAPLLAMDWGSNIYARDMHERNIHLLREHPERPLYLLRPTTAAAGAPPVLFPLRRDSVLAAWQPAD